MTDPKGVPAVPVTPARSQGMAAVVLTAALIGGVAGGVLLDRYVLLPSDPPTSTAAVAVADTVRPSPSNRGRGGSGRGNPAEMRRRFSERLARDLSLTPEQHTRMDSIFARQFAAMDRLQKSMRPAFDSIQTAAQASIDSLLSAEQRAKLAELRSRRRRSGGPDSLRDSRGDSARRSSVER